MKSGTKREWLVAALLMYAGCAPFKAGPEAVDVSGSWKGSWFDSGGGTGGLTMNLVQHSGAVSGTVNLAGACFVADANLSASLDGDQLDGSFSGSLTQVTIEGTAATAHIDGSYTVSKGICSGAHGTFTLDRE